MTQKQYMKRVKRGLRLPAKMKSAVLADLKETFDSARERGESEASAIERMGLPQDFISDIHQNCDLSDKQKKFLRLERSISTATIVSGILAVACTGMMVIKSLNRNNVIGYSDAPTSIAVVGGNGWALPIAGIVLLWLILAILTICLLYARRQANRKQ